MPVYASRRASAETIVRRIEEEVVLIYVFLRYVICNNEPRSISDSFIKLTKKYQ